MISLLASVKLAFPLSFWNKRFFLAFSRQKTSKLSTIKESWWLQRENKKSNGSNTYARTTLYPCLKSTKHTCCPKNPTMNEEPTMKSKTNAFTERKTNCNLELYTESSTKLWIATVFIKCLLNWWNETWKPKKSFAIHILMKGKY